MTAHEVVARVRAAGHRKRTVSLRAMQQWLAELADRGYLERDGDDVRRLIDPHGCISLALGESDEETIANLYRAGQAEGANRAAARRRVAA
jgi:hypothetical protein